MCKNINADLLLAVRGPEREDPPRVLSRQGSKFQLSNLTFYPLSRIPAFSHVPRGRGGHGCCFAVSAGLFIGNEVAFGSSSWVDIQTEHATSPSLPPTLALRGCYLRRRHSLWTTKARCVKLVGDSLCCAVNWQLHPQQRHTCQPRSTPPPLPPGAVLFAARWYVR